MLVSPLLDILSVQKTHIFLREVQESAHLMAVEPTVLETASRRLSDFLLPFQREKGGVLHGNSIFIIYIYIHNIHNIYT